MMKSVLGTYRSLLPLELSGASEQYFALQLIIFKSALLHSQFGQAPQPFHQQATNP